MKSAINMCTWQGYANHTNIPFSATDFFRDAAEAGYDGVEVGGGASVLGEPADCLAKLAALGMKISAYSTSVTYNPWPPNTDQYQKDIEYAAQLGATTLMVCGGFIPSPRRNTYDFDYDMFAGNLQATLDYAAKHGISVAYHPHRGSIVETTAETAKMVARLPHLQLCPDFAHLEASGENTLGFIATFGDRCIYTHVKDYRWDTDEFTELGKGQSKLVVKDCIAALQNRGYDGWLCVELDKKFSGENPRTPLESARISREYLREHCGV